MGFFYGSPRSWESWYTIKIKFPVDFYSVLTKRTQRQEANKSHTTTFISQPRRWVEWVKANPYLWMTTVPHSWLLPPWSYWQRLFWQTLLPCPVLLLFSLPSTCYPSHWPHICTCREQRIWCPRTEQALENWYWDVIWLKIIGKWSTFIFPLYLSHMNSSLFIGKIKRKGAVGRRGCKKPTDLNLALGQKGH